MPMVGSIFSGKIRDLSVKGYGVVDHPDGLVFFVQGTWPGDEGEFEVIESDRRYGFAKIKKIFRKSEHRIDAPCPHLGWERGQCGGCPWMIADYSSQLFYKKKFLDYQIKRTSLKYTDFTVHPIWGSEKIYGYRNRAQLKTDGNQVGFVSSQSRDIAPINDCIILSEKNRTTLQNARQSLPNARWQPTGDHIWNFFEIDEDVSFENIQINKRRPFLQGNSQQNLRMRDWLRDQLSRQDREQSVLELFCGSGNFTEVIASLGFKKIIATEISEQAVAALQERKLPNVEAVAVNLESQKSFSKIRAHAQNPEILVLDPPRTGFEDLARLTAECLSLKAIYYISCDVLTYLRDVKKLEAHGWKIKEIQPLDQFPHTTHLELLSVILR